MSSAKRSRGPPNPGNEPTEELGYPALVQYTFVPNDTESSEILVSEGDIVQLVYKVGGWVFVRTYDGKVGYIPFSFCRELERSKEVGSTYCDNEVKRNYVNIPQSTKSIAGKSFTKTVTDFKDITKQLRRSVKTSNKITSESSKQQTKSEKRVHFADQPKCRNSCDICRNFLTSFNSVEYNYTSKVGQKKITFKPHKLLKLLQTISKEGLIYSANSRSTNNAQSMFGEITDNRINRRVNSSELPIKFGNFCNQCDVLKDIFKNNNRYSMSDLYSTIRSLHLHALTDSDSEQEEYSEDNDVSEGINGHIQNGGSVIFPAEKMPKRSISFKEPELKQKVEIVRNNSFNGITGNELTELRNGISSPTEESSNQPDVYNSSITTVACSRADQSRSNFESSPKYSVIQNHKVNNYFPENKPNHFGPPLMNGYEEERTDFRAAEYHPPLFNKWRPASDSLPAEAIKQRPPGIVREQTFVYDSMKSRQKEVNFNDPRKENLNFYKTSENKPNTNSSLQMRTFTQDSRRKPIVSNGDFSLDDHENDEIDNGESSSDGSSPGALTKCFTTYGHVGSFQPGVNTGKSMTLDRNFKLSSQFSNSEDIDNVGKKNSHGSTYKDNNYPKQTETDSAIDRRKIVARKVNPVMSPRGLLTPGGPLIGRKNDKDIRKSLSEHSAMKKTMSSASEPMRPQPMRAQHDIASQNEASSASNRTVLVKKFNKQMWRPSLAGSEGSDQRPFSPFGGTLPPSKIVKKKVVEVFV